MKSSALEWKLACLVTLIVAAVPFMLTSCAGGIVSPSTSGTSQQNKGVTITSVVPNSGPLAGGTVVTINGSNFTSASQPTPPSVSFGGTQATNVRVISPLQLSAKVPPHAAGSVAVAVTTADGQSSTLPQAFTYDTSTKLSVNSVSPSSGDTTGGTVVTVAGNNFASGATVSFGGTSASNVSFISSTQLTATTPAHTAGSVNVSVTNPDGASTSLAGAFSFGTTSLKVSAVSPISGPADGGTTVTISGADFQSGASVTIGGLPAASVTVSNSTTIEAVTPAHASGAAEVTVTNSSGDSAALPSGFTFHSIDLLWNAPSSSTLTIAGYNVYRGPSSAGPFGRLNGSTPVAVTSFDDPTVLGGTTYYYEVRSVDSNGTESAPAGPVPATTSP